MLLFLGNNVCPANKYKFNYYKAEIVLRIIITTLIQQRKKTFLFSVGGNENGMKIFFLWLHGCCPDHSLLNYCHPFISYVSPSFSNYWSSKRFLTSLPWPAPATVTEVCQPNCPFSAFMGIIPSSILMICKYRNKLNISWESLERNLS